jgi:molybdopterin synthase catalytic subunit
MKQSTPSLDQWLREAKQEPTAPLCGMYLAHNGTVRQTARAKVRQGAEDTAPVTGMYFDYDPQKLEAAVAAAKALPGIYHVRVWLNRGELALGDDIMLVLIGGDIRPRVIDALQDLVGRIMTECVTEEEITEAE